MKKLNFNTADFRFRDLVSEYLNISKLSSLHKDFPFAERLTDAKGGNPDQGQPLHRLFYDGMDNDPQNRFKNLYDSFIQKHIYPLFDCPLVFQAFPTFRIHQPDNICVFDWHRDREFNHNPSEMNVFLPITKAYDTNTIWAESEDGKGDYAPMEANYGEYIVWNGANLRHGNKDNNTPDTRISIDFRVIKHEDYSKAAAKSSITLGTSLVMGKYFDERIADGKNLCPS